MEENMFNMNSLFDNSTPTVNGTCCICIFS